LEAKRRELQKMERECERTYRLFANETLSEAEFAPLDKPLQARKKELEDEIPRAEAELDLLRINEISTDDVVSEFNELYSKWPTLTREKRRSVVENITERIVIEKGNQGSIVIDLAYMPSFEN